MLRMLVRLLCCFFTVSKQTLEIVNFHFFIYL